MGILSKIFEYAKRVPWWIWIGLVALLIIGWQMQSGWSYAKKLYKELLTDVRQDQAKIIESKNAEIDVLENTVDALEKEKAKLQADKAALQKQSATSAAQVIALRGKIDELQKKYDAIIVSSDPGIVVSDINKRIGGSVKVIPRPNP